MMQDRIAPGKLYGRDREKAILWESYEHVGRGFGRILLVPGLSGAGKTSLVESLRTPVLDENGFFIQGKFDQYRQNIPYFSLRQALAELCHQLLTGSAQQQSHNKEEILQAIGGHGQLLVDLVPEFGNLLGTQPPLGDISPQEARHRFTHVFQEFFRAVCRPDHPLVLFLDDWQWADPASLMLLEQLLIGTRLRHILLIISYRRNEVDSTHPLMSAIEDLRLQNAPVEELPVENIRLEDIRNLLVDTLQPFVESPEELSSLIQGKTQGNPFFIWSFLVFLQDFFLLWFDTAKNRWMWSTDRFSESRLPANVITLFILKLRRLDADVCNLFSLAACLGNRFTLDALSIISGLSPERCRALLFSDQARGLLLPVEATGIDHGPANIPLPTADCRFLHDSVQQAAYSLIETADLPSLLLRIGRMLLARLYPEQLSDRIFEVVNNLNAGRHLLADPEEQVRLVELNILAARKAFTATAYRSALQYYRAAHFFLSLPGMDEHLWRGFHKLTLALCKELSECEFIEGNYAEAEQLLREAVTRTQNSLEKADVLNKLIVQHTLLAKYPEAIAAGRQALDSLGISLPEEEYETACREEVAKVRLQLQDRSVASLFELPVMSQPEMLMASTILITMGPPCYRSHQRLWSVIVPKVVNLTLQYGNIPQVGYSHTAFGGLLGWLDNDYSTAREFGDLATRLMTSTFLSSSAQSVFYLMYGSSTRHWFYHMRNSSQDYTDAVEIGVRSSNLQYAAYAFGHNMYCCFFQGIPLQELIRDSQYSLEFSHIRRNQWAIDLLEGGISIFAALSDQSPQLYLTETWSEDRYCRKVKDHQNIQVTCIYQILRTFYLLVMGQWEEALSLSDQVQPILYTVGVQGLLPWPEHTTARLLILSHLYARQEPEVQSLWSREMAAMRQRMHVWAENCPANFSHKRLLAAAEQSRLENRPMEALLFYDEAIQSALAVGFRQWEALIGERAFSLCLECGNQRLAQTYWLQSFGAYSRWGAQAKVKAMSAAYLTELASSLPPGHFGGTIEYADLQHRKDQFLSKQSRQLEEYLSHIHQSRLRADAEAKVEELTRATERLRTETTEPRKALQKIEEQYRTILQTAMDGFMLLDAEGRILEANESYARISGYSLPELPGKHISELVAPEFRDRVWENLRKIQEQGEHRLESRHRRKDGSSFDTDASVQFRPIDGGQFVVFLRDITSRKEAEAKLLQSTETMQQKTIELDLALLKADEANRAKSEFLANMSHEIRTPMNGVIGMTGLLLDTDLSEEQRRYAESVRNSAESLLSLINDILDFSKIEAQKLDLEIQDFDLSAMLDDYALTPALRAQEKGIELICTIDPDVPVRLQGDPGRLRQILTNLTANAVKFTHSGEVVLRASLDEDSEKDVLVRFSVRDTGIGIPDDKLSILFDKFTQADTTTSRRYGGTGLGLAISKQLAELMGGQIGVRSKEGVGSEFWFTARLGKQAHPASRDVAAEAELARVRALVVDDSPTCREVLCRHMKSWGMRVSQTSDGTEALQFIYLALAEKDPYRIVLIDQQMPLMDGETLGRTIRTDPLLARTRLLLLLPLGPHGDSHHFQRLGFSSLTTKPVRIQELKAALIRALSQQESVGAPPLLPGAERPVREISHLFAGSSARILLAEDNITNQQVAMGLLKKMGLQADTVGNGAEAVRALESASYDLVLMDVQMPGMDGLEATRAIRHSISRADNRRIPVIAMTAHAMQRDRQKCMEAGMDDYISKPITPQTLAECLEKWLPQKSDARSRVPSIRSQAPPMDISAAKEDFVFDKAKLLARLLDDQELATTVLQGFLDGILEQLLHLQTCLDSDDAAGAERWAHTIKGASANVGGEGLRLAADEMERFSRGGQINSAKGYFPALRREADRLIDAIHRSEIL